MYKTVIHMPYNILDRLTDYMVYRNMTYKKVRSFKPLIADYCLIEITAANWNDIDEINAYVYEMIGEF